MTDDAKPEQLDDSKVEKLGVALDKCHTDYLKAAAEAISSPTSTGKSMKEIVGDFAECEADAWLNYTATPSVSKAGNAHEK